MALGFLFRSIVCKMLGKKGAIGKKILPFGNQYNQNGLSRCTVCFKNNQLILTKLSAIQAVRYKHFSTQQTASHWVILNQGLIAFSMVVIFL